MNILSAIDAIAISDAPTRPDRILADRKAQMIRATTSQGSQQIPCPGGCGAMASLESPMMVTREGITRRIQVAQCLGGCRREIRSGLGRVKKVAARFDLPMDDEAEETVVVEDAKGEEKGDVAALMMSAMRASGLRQSQAAGQLGISQSAVSKLLNGHPVAPKTLIAAKDWALSILSPEARREVHSEQNGVAKKPTAEKPRAESLGATDEDIPSSRLVIVQPESIPTPKPEKKAEPAPEPCPLPLSQDSGRSDSPYEAVIRTLLEEVAQRRLEELAGDAARGVVVRVTLEWAPADG